MKKETTSYGATRITLNNVIIETAPQLHTIRIKDGGGLFGNGTCTTSPIVDFVEAGKEYMRAKSRYPHLEVIWEVENANHSNLNYKNS